MRWSSNNEWKPTNWIIIQFQGWKIDLKPPTAGGCLQHPFCCCGSFSITATLHLTFFLSSWNPSAFFEHVPSPSFSQVHLQVTENPRLTGAVQLQGRCSKGARDLQRTKLWTLQSSQLQNQTSIRDQDISRHIKTYQDSIKTLSKPKVTNTSGRYQRMQSCTLHSAQNRCSSG